MMSGGIGAPPAGPEHARFARTTRIRLEKRENIAEGGGVHIFTVMPSPGQKAFSARVLPGNISLSQERVVVTFSPA